MKIALDIINKKRKAFIKPIYSLLISNRRVVVLVIRYAIRSAKSGHPAVGQSLDRLVQRWL